MAHVGAMFAEAAARPELAGRIHASIARNDSLPEIARATALEYLTGSDDGAAAAIFRNSLHDQDPLIRHTAVRHYPANDSAQFVSDLTPMLRDSVRAVRIEAANKFTPFRREQFSDSGYLAYQNALVEYKAAMNYAADFPAGRFNLAKYYDESGNSQEAEDNYRESIAIDGLFYPAKVNLAFLYYRSSRLDKAESLFLDVSAHHPEYPDADYNLGLLYAEERRFGDAVKRLETAAKKHGSPKVYYNLALLYQRVNQDGKSETLLLKSLAETPGEFRTLYALCDLYVRAKQFSKAEKYADELRTRYPGDPDAQKLVSYIRSRRSP